MGLLDRLTLKPQWSCLGFTRGLGLELRSSCLHTKYFAYPAMALVISG